MRVDFVSLVRMSRFVCFNRYNIFRFPRRCVTTVSIIIYLTRNLELDSDSIHPSELCLQRLLLFLRACLEARYKREIHPAYWKKLNLLGQRQMIEFDVQALLAEIFAATKIIGGTKAGECKKIADQVRLIKVSIIQCELCPIVRGNPMR